jgi:hypothetical protein
MTEITAPRYVVVAGETDCYSCGMRVAVASLAVPPEASVKDDDYPLAPGAHGWLGLSELDELSADLKAFAPGIRLDESATAQIRYYMHHCGKCGAKIGDFFLHRPGGPFFGEDTAGLKVSLVAQPIRVSASYSDGPLGDWLAEIVKE